MDTKIERLLQCQSSLDSASELLETTGLSKETFSSTLNECLAAIGMEQKQLAAQLGVSPPTVNRWSRGRNIPYPVVTKLVLAQLLELIQKQLIDSEINTPYMEI